MKAFEIFLFSESPFLPLSARSFRTKVWAAVLTLGFLAVEPLRGQPVEVDGRTNRAPAVVLMVLSPRMPYALQEWPRMKRVAERAGFVVLAARDSRVPKQEWEAAVQAVHLFELWDAPMLDEQTGIDLGLLHHAPSSVVVRCGVPHPWPILGVVPDQTWVELLRHREAGLGALSCL